MLSFVARIGFPLLTKELIEQSARRRTYLVRVVYAVALYGVTLWTYWRWLQQFEDNSFELLGQGDTLFRELIRWQFWGLYLFLPVVTSSAITAEKERDTLSLLMLTKLGSWTILFEKLLSRLVAMGSFLLLGLPLAAVAYSLGGVEVESILKATYVLSVTSLQVASFALLCSTWFRTTSSAFVGTYLLGTVGVLFGSELLKLVLSLGITLGAHQFPWPGLTDEGREWFVASVRENPSYRPLYGPWLLQSDPLGTENVAQMLGLMPTSGRVNLNSVSDYFLYSRDISLSYGIQQTMRSQAASALLWLGAAVPTPSAALDRVTLAECIACSLPLVASALAFLILARVFLWRRMRVPERSLLTKLFLFGDRCFQMLNRNPITRGIVFGSRKDDLPAERPIAWRETRKRSLGNARHLVRLLLLLEVPLLGWIVFRLLTWDGAGSPPLASGAFLPLWLLTILIVTIQSTGLIAAEKSRQTLDTLLTAPLPSRDIVLQKMAGLRRLMLVLATPLLTVLLTNWAWGRLGTSVAERFGSWEVSGGQLWVDVNQSVSMPYPLTVRGGVVVGLDASFSTRPTSPLDAVVMLAGQVAGVFLYLALLAWIGFQLGLRLKTQTQAVWLTLLAVAVLCFGPLLAVKGIDAAQHWLATTPQLSPAGVTGVLLVDVDLDSDSFPGFGIPRPIWLTGLAWLSPLRVSFPGSFTHDYGDRPHMIWFLLLFHFLVYGGMLCILRRNALSSFSRLVRRAEPAVNRRGRVPDVESSEKVMTCPT